MWEFMQSLNHWDWLALAAVLLTLEVFGAWLAACMDG